MEMKLWQFREVLGMARKPRIEYPGAIYHVMVRGNNREEIFLQDRDKEKYLEIVKKYKEKYDFKLYAYTCLKNHGHMLMETAETPLSKIMQGIQQVYTHYCNKKYERVGHVFQQRYKAKLCENQAYFLGLIRYIHKNPLEAGLSANLDYPWSSHSSYLQPQKKSIVDVDFPLSFFGPKLKKAVEGYSFFMTDDSQATAEIPRDSECFWREQVADQLRQAFEGVLLEIEEKTGVRKTDILNKRKCQDIVLARREFITVACARYGCSHADIAQYLGISKTAVAKSLQAPLPYPYRGEPKDCRA